MTLTHFPKSEFWNFGWLFFNDAYSFPGFWIFFQDSRIGVKGANERSHEKHKIAESLSLPLPEWPAEIKKTRFKISPNQATEGKSPSVDTSTVEVAQVDQKTIDTN